MATAACAAIVGAALGAPAPQESPLHHLVYLHGRVVQEQQSAKAVHPSFGVYDLDAIAAALRARGFTVHASIRPKGETVDASAARTATELRALHDTGVPVDRIALVGASMGASIALEVAERLALPQLRVVLLGACLSANVAALRTTGGRGPSGRILVLLEASDESTDGCAPWPESANDASLLGRELELSTALRHRFLCRPVPAGLDPAVRWLRPSGLASGGPPSSPLPEPLLVVGAIVGV